MTITFAIAGKGGVGKTAVSAIIIDILSARGTVLAVDADPSMNLNDALGVKVNSTLGRTREKMSVDMQSGLLTQAASKQEIFESRIFQSLAEGEKFDLLAMGRPEGPGCYCAANHMIRFSIDRLARHYDFVVMDCEAGMEHISRQTTQDIDFLLAVTDPTMRGLTTAFRLQKLISEMRTEVKQGVYLVVNRVRDGLPPEIEGAIVQSGLPLLATLPEDSGITELDVSGRPLTELPADSVFRRSVAGLLAKLIDDGEQ